MQVAVEFRGGVEEYQRKEGFRFITRPSLCGHCEGPLEPLGYYWRNVSGSRRYEVFRIRIMRLICGVCRLTTSCLPSFAQPYRLVATEQLERHALAKEGAAQDDPWLSLLKIYLRVISRFLGEFFKRIGNYFGRPPPEARRDGRALVAWLTKLRGSLATATEQLINHLGTCLFGAYRCHKKNRRSSQDKGGIRPAPARNRGTPHT